MEFLYFLEKLRTPFFDWFFSLITHLGEETVFLVVAILMFWCVSKRKGYFILITGFFGTIVNQIMKLAFKIPRPWAKDPNFTIVEGARTEATGYSFPSGHTQTAVSTFGGLALLYNKKWVRIGGIVIAVLVAFSRMYLGVHTPWDVLAGVGTAMLIIFLLESLFANEQIHKKAMPYLVGGIALASLLFFIYAVIITPVNTDVNTVSAAKNACTLLGCSAGLILVYILDEKVIKFETGARWYAQLIKLVVGIGIIFLIKTFLKIPLAAWLGSYYERIIRYFVIVAFAGAVWPLTFRYFAKLQIPTLDKFGEWAVAALKSFFGKIAAFFVLLWGKTVALFRREKTVDSNTAKVDTAKGKKAKK